MTRNLSHESGGAPILDDGTLQSLAALAGEDDPELVNELIDLFLDDAAGRLRSMAAGMEADQYEPVAQAAHALKSASANVGALTFSDLCSEIERVAREEGDVGDLVSTCLELFEQVRAAMQAYRPDQV